MDQISTQCSQVQELGSCFPRQQPSITAVSGACSTFSWRRCLAWPICLRHGCMDSYSYVVRAWSSGRLLIESPVRSARSTAKISSHSRSSVGGLCHISVAALRNGDEGHMFSEDTEFRPVSEAHANETFSARSGAESLKSTASGDEADILAEGISVAVPRGFSPSDGASQLVFPSPRKRNGASHGNPVEEAISWPDSGGEEERSASLRKLATDMFLVKTSSQFEVDYLGESTKGDMNVKRDVIEAFDNEGVSTLEGPIEEVAKIEAKEAKTLLDGLRIPARFPHGDAQRGIFCSRTLNLRSITTIGYDMDYTLIHYNVNAWEGRAYEYGMDNLRSMGYPVDGLQFDPELVIRGLIMDKENGNLVKADRFGYVKRAMHGTRMLSNRAISEMYGRELVDLRNETRWEFLNTLFSVSEAVMYMQMVDRLDEGALPPEVGPLDYCGLHKVVAKALFRAHVEGQLKDEIINQPERFVEPDPELPLALLDQREAGKRLILITNSDYHYTNKMMQHAFNQFLPNGLDWRSLFDMVIVSARKPEFFQMSHPLYEIVTEDGLMQPCFKARSGGLYCGGSAQMVENALGFQGDETLYVGDHIYTDVSQSKVHLRWRTALICRELEEEVKALACGREHRAKLIELMNQKEVVGHVFNQLRLALQRRTAGYAGQYALYVRQSCFVRPEFKSSFLPYLLLQTLSATDMDERELAESMQKLLIIMQRLDQKIAPMLEADGNYFNKRWGYLSRAGLWDKSHLTRQIEKYADIYTSRVSNFLCYTPFMYFRSQAQTLAHDLLPHWPESYSEYT